MTERVKKQVESWIKHYYCKIASSLVVAILVLTVLHLVLEMMINFYKLLIFVFVFCTKVKASSRSIYLTRQSKTQPPVSLKLFVLSVKRKAVSICKLLTSNNNGNGKLSQMLATGEELHMKKNENLHHEVLKAVKKATDYMKLDSWELLGDEEGVKVWKLKKSVLSGDGAEWPCIKSVTTVNMRPEKLRDLLMDSEKVHLLNRFSAGRDDVVTLNKHSKVVWNKTKMPYAMKPYDFCTLMHTYKDPHTGNDIIISQGLSHSSVPLNKEYARSHIIMGINILAPSVTDATQTELTSISHVRYANIPTFLAKKSSFAGTVSYLTQLKEAAAKLSKQ